MRTTAYVGAHYEKDVIANTTTSYYYLGGQRIGVRRRGVLYYLHSNHPGSASLTTDARLKPHRNFWMPSVLTCGSMVTNMTLSGTGPATR